MGIKSSKHSESNQDAQVSYSVSSNSMGNPSATNLESLQTKRVSYSNNLFLDGEATNNKCLSHGKEDWISTVLQKEISPIQRRTEKISTDIDYEEIYLSSDDDWTHIDTRHSYEEIDSALKDVWRYNNCNHDSPFQEDDWKYNDSVHNCEKNNSYPLFLRDRAYKDPVLPCKEIESTPKVVWRYNYADHSCRAKNSSEIDGWGYNNPDHDSEDDRPPRKDGWKYNVSAHYCKENGSSSVFDWRGNDCSPACEEIDSAQKDAWGFKEVVYDYREKDSTLIYRWKCKDSDHDSEEDYWKPDDSDHDSEDYDWKPADSDHDSEDEDWKHDDTDNVSEEDYWGHYGGITGDYNNSKENISSLIYKWRYNDSNYACEETKSVIKNDWRGRDFGHNYKDTDSTSVYYGHASDHLEDDCKCNGSEYNCKENDLNLVYDGVHGDSSRKWGYNDSYKNSEGKDPPQGDDWGCNDTDHNSKENDSPSVYDSGFSDNAHYNEENINISLKKEHTLLLRFFEKLVDNLMERLFIGYSEVCTSLKRMVYNYKGVIKGKLPIQTDQYDVSYCLGYLHRYAACHTVLVSESLCNIFKSPASNYLITKMKKKRLSTIFLGGGPGNDFLGLLTILSNYRENLLDLDVTVVDQLSSWEDVFSETIQQLNLNSIFPNADVTTAFISSDLKNCNEWSTVLKNKLQKADLLFLVKVLSHIPNYDKPAVLENIIRYTKPGALLIYIDFPYPKRAFASVAGSLKPVYTSRSRSYKLKAKMCKFGYYNNQRCTAEVRMFERY